eukprot:13817126-Ditylum_brightwellii.AAC.1
MDVTHETVEKVAALMQGTMEPGGVDSITWQNWVLKFGAAIQKLRVTITELACWLTNTRPAWAAYQTIVANRLIALDKCLGVHLIGISEVFFWMLDKYIIGVCGNDVTKVCSSNQLCSGLKAGIEGAVHSMKQLQNEHGKEEDLGILLFNVQTTLNEVNCCEMLWNV